MSVAAVFLCAVCRGRIETTEGYRLLDRPELEAGGRSSSLGKRLQWILGMDIPSLLSVCVCKCYHRLILTAEKALNKC